MLKWFYGAHNIYLLINNARIMSYRKMVATRGGNVNKAYSTFYVINIVFQSIFTLLWQILTALALGWIFVRKLNAPEWIYVPLILAGVITGFVSMVRFILTAMKSLERIEAQGRKKKKSEEKINGKQE